MKKMLTEMPQRTPFSGLPPLAPERSIHLVALPQAKPVSPAVVATITFPRQSWRKSHPIRESERMGTAALAGAALIAPMVWMGHALLVWLDIL